MKSHYINGKYVEGEGGPFTSIDPAYGKKIWFGSSAGEQTVAKAVQAAQQALNGWAMRRPDDRIALIQKYKQALEKHRKELQECIAKETGKPLWESDTEAGSMIAKVDISIKAYEDRCRELKVDGAGFSGKAVYHAHGVCAILGPFNFPGHLPNGHLVPALIAGNTIVFKPSEKTPSVAELIVKCLEEAGLPPGVFNVVQGALTTAKALLNQPELRAVLFTGSVPAGLAIHRHFAGRPEVLLALEMGGNNPLVITRVQNVEAAAFTTLQSAFISSGQRCTCARRLVITEDGNGEEVLHALIEAAQKIKIGRYDDEPQPFYGTLINEQAADFVLQEQERLRAKRGKLLLDGNKAGAAMVTPGIIDMTYAGPEDQEVFGPFLQVVRVANFEEAINEANNTRFGLAASLLSDDANQFEKFFKTIYAGIINFNRPTSGASSALPFGGLGMSGNYRPSAYLAADYTAHAVASVHSPEVAMPPKAMAGLEDCFQWQ